MLAICHLAEPSALWNTHKHSLCQDIIDRLTRINASHDLQHIMISAEENECLAMMQN